MEKSIEMLLSSSSFYHLTGLVAATLFFFMIGVRELKDQRAEGFLYLTLSLFFGAAHVFYLFNVPIDNELSFWIARMNVWTWTTLIFAPALIGLFLLVGLYNFLQANARVGMLKLFFGLTLLCYLYMLGTEWPTDIKGFIAIFWLLIWFEVEFRTAN